MDDFGNELPALTAQQVNERFDKGSERMAAIERELGKTRQELGELKQQLADLLEFFTAMKGAFKVLNWLGKLARPTAAIVALGVALTAAWNAARGIYPK
ncbi:hypothetical protein KW830_05430 [Comamonas sp. CMM03]|uniref:hypothetical protein n=1 Tax=Comamonas sp. CMM03 TaxID=2854781 RepID=UPI001C48A6F6|nr:hypothetical protein [Comamonas sp. CMM03]MBV7417893.1 hypothetical protein [Comamonas sp. CMM03]